MATETGQQAFRQGDTTTVTMVRNEALPEGRDIKAGFYNPAGNPLFEAKLSDGGIQQVDGTHFIINIPYETSRKITGPTTFRAVEFTADRQYVNAGENAIQVNWTSEPVSQNL